MSGAELEGDMAGKYVGLGLCDILLAASQTEALVVVDRCVASW